MTPEAKARAWELAARVLKWWDEDETIANRRSAENRHIREVVIPSLRRRAAIIRQNAKKKRKP